MVNNIYQKSIEVNNLCKKQRMKSNAVIGKKNKANMIEGQQKIIQEGALLDSDRELLAILRNYLDDILENTYNPLVNEVFRQISPNSGTEFTKAEFDNFHFFKFSSFMIDVQRMKAYEAHQKQQKEAIEAAKQRQNEAEPAQDNGRSLFDNKKPSSKQASKVQVSKVPFKIDINNIGASLQLQNFEFLYTQMYHKIKIKQKEKDKEVQDKEFHSALQLLIQFLYIIRDMASSDDEKN
jgi:hypothetical protein